MVFRYARHTNSIDKLIVFYRDIIGLEVLATFENHNGYDGVFIGKSDSNWHIEFTQNTDATNHHFDADDVLVFYPDSTIEYDQILNALDKACIKQEIPKNPYWQRNGIQISDPDGYGIIISKQKVR